MSVDYKLLNCVPEMIEQVRFVEVIISFIMTYCDTKLKNFEQNKSRLPKFRSIAHHLQHSLLYQQANLLKQKRQVSTEKFYV